MKLIVVDVFGAIAHAITRVCVCGPACKYGFFREGVGCVWVWYVFCSLSIQEKFQETNSAIDTIRHAGRWSRICPGLRENLANLRFFIDDNQVGTTFP